MDLIFFLNSALLGVGLAMDAFSVSLANGLNEPHCKLRKVVLISGVFAVFQALMPMIGWICVHTVLGVFSAFGKVVPVIALVLLLMIGGKMLWDGIKPQKGDAGNTGTSFGALIVQGIATSIDALSVGFTIADETALNALVSAVIIAAVTFVICFAGVFIGKTFGTRLSSKATVLGGIILIGIGLEIFIKGMFF